MPFVLLLSLLVEVLEDLIDFVSVLFILFPRVGDQSGQVMVFVGELDVFSLYPPVHVVNVGILLLE